jgi:predicted secreted protein
MAVISSCFVVLTRIAIPASKDSIDFNVAGPLGVLEIDVGMDVAGVAVPEEQEGRAKIRTRLSPINRAMICFLFMIVLLTKKYFYLLIVGSPIDYTTTRQFEIEGGGLRITAFDSNCSECHNKGKSLEGNMKARLAIVCIMTAILLGLLACSSGETKALSVDISSSDKTVTLASGGTLTVTLESNITTGYSWNETSEISDLTVMQQTDHKYQPPATVAVGAGGTEIWNFKALKEGTSTITMRYRRPNEPPIEVIGIIPGVMVTAPPTKIFTLSVVVQ